MALSTAFVVFTVVSVAAILWLVFVTAPKSGNENVVVYVAICSLLGGFDVVSAKALGIAVKLSFSGHSQMFYPDTYIFTLVTSLIHCRVVNMFACSFLCSALPPGAHALTCAEELLVFIEGM